MCHAPLVTAASRYCLCPLTVEVCLSHSPWHSVPLLPTQGKHKETYDWFWPKDHPKTFSGELVLATPDVYEVPLEAEDEFVLLACDGLWEVSHPSDHSRQRASFITRAT